MKKSLLLILGLLSFYYSIAIPPTPNEYSLKVNAFADLIVEGTVVKRDTINVSENESYFLYSIDVVYILKNKIAKKDSVVKILVKRDLDWEYAFVQEEHHRPIYLNLKDRHVFFLRENQIKSLSAIKSAYDFFDTWSASKIFFTTSSNSTVEAYGLDLDFLTLQDLYQFIKLLPETNVPTSLTDYPQNKWWIKPDVYYQPKVEVRQKNRLDSLFDKKQEILLEKHKQLQKKSPNQRLKAAPVLNIKLANPTFVYTSTATKLEFDVLLSASANIYLDNMVLRLKYNTSAFGTNVATNKGITITKATGWGVSYNDPNANAYDYATDVVTVPIGVADYASLTAPRTLVTSTLSKCLRISMIIKDCNQSANISATDVANTSILSLYLNTSLGSSINSLDFSSSNYSGTINPTALCKPNITSVSPTTVTAGTNSKITITGFGFGATRGTGAVKFRNSNLQNYAPITTNDDIDVVSWSDTKIEYIVPSVMLNVTGATSGSGPITVIENTGKESVPSSDIITIPYAITNIKSGGKKYATIHTETPSGTPGKITFYVTEELFKATSYYNLVKRAINELSCATTVNFELASTFVSNAKIGSLKDGISVISLADDNLFSNPSVLMETSRFTTQACTKGSQMWFTSSESDIIIKRSVNWSILPPESDLELNKVDFFNAIIHELGHAAGLDHVISTTDLMRSTLSKGFLPSYNRFTYLTSSFDPSVDGVLWLLNEGDKYTTVGSNCVGINTVTKKKNCTLVTDVEDDIQTKSSFKLISNPVTNQEAVFSVGTNFHNSTLNYEIINIHGQRLVSSEVVSNNNFTIPMHNLDSNLYLINFTEQNGNRHSFKVIKQ